MDTKQDKSAKPAQMTSLADLLAVKSEYDHLMEEYTDERIAEFLLNNSIGI